MKRAIIRAVAWATAGFIVLLGLRLGYGYLEHPDGRAAPASSGDDGGGFELEKRNYASAKIARAPRDGAAKAATPGTPGAPVTIDQKYERVADVRARAATFDDDEAAIRRAADGHGGVIQLERKQGLRGHRVLHLAVGVAPERFDAFVEAVRAVGTAAYVTIDKQDRTNDFKELAAKRAVLEASRDALIALKQRSGSIEELVALEDRILDVHQQIQSLGISLGEYDEVNELCTVKLTLTERVDAPVAAGPTIPIWRRLRAAVDWTVPTYLRLVGILLCAALVGVAGVVVVERVAPLQRAIAELRQGMSRADT
jgi:hypothetical protein